MCADKRVLHFAFCAKYAAVGSTGQRNGSIKGISWRLEAKRFPRPRIEPEGNLIEVALSVYG